MKRVSLRRYVVRGLTLLIGAVFVYAGMIKAHAPDEFRAQIVAYRIVPAGWATDVAYGLPFVEAIVGFWLLLGWRLRLPALCIVVLSTIFSLAIAQALFRGFDLACGCFGRERGAGHMWLSLMLDLTLFAGAWIVYRAASGDRAALNERTTTSQ